MTENSRERERDNLQSSCHGVSEIQDQSLWSRRCFGFTLLWFGRISEVADSLQVVGCDHAVVDVRCVERIRCNGQQMAGLHEDDNKFVLWDTADDFNKLVELGTRDCLVFADEGFTGHNLGLDNVGAASKNGAGFAWLVARGVKTNCAEEVTAGFENVDIFFFVQIDLAVFAWWDPNGLDRRQMCVESVFAINVEELLQERGGFSGQCFFDSSPNRFSSGCVAILRVLCLLASRLEQIADWTMFVNEYPLGECLDDCL